MVDIKPITNDCEVCGNEFDVPPWNKRIPPTCPDCWFDVDGETRGELMAEQWPEVQVNG